MSNSVSFENQIKDYQDKINLLDLARLNIDTLTQDVIMITLE